LILDEPAAGMNQVEAAGIGALIQALPRQGVTVLLIEHNVRLVLATCSRIVVLNFGEVIAAGTPAEISSDPVVIAAYLGDDSSAQSAQSEAEAGAGAGA
jgi:branched-chain amino acid transport system permease protein